MMIDLVDLIHLHLRQPTSLSRRFDLQMHLCLYPAIIMRRCFYEDSLLTTKRIKNSPRFNCQLVSLARRTACVSLRKSGTLACGDRYNFRLHVPPAAP